MIENSYGFHSLVCDFCGESEITAFENFQEALDFKSESDWETVKVDGELQDMCPECQQHGAFDV